MTDESVCNNIKEEKKIISKQKKKTRKVEFFFSFKQVNE